MDYGNFDFLSFFLILEEDIDIYDGIILSHQKKKIENHTHRMKYFQ